MSITTNLAFRQTKGFVGNKQKQKQKQQFKQSSTRILSYRTTSQSIQQLIQSHCPNNPKAFQTIQQLRILHSQYLHSLHGIQLFSSSLLTANLNSNTITSIQGIQYLTKLQTLELRNNRIQSLRGVEKCVSLVKLDVSNNLVSSFEGLSEVSENSRLERLCLAGNKLSDLNDLGWLANCKRIKQIVFTKGKSTNPLCENYGDYIIVLSQTLFKMKHSPNINIDDLPLRQHLKQFQQSNYGYSSNGENIENNQEERLYGYTEESMMEKQRQMGINVNQNVLKNSSNSMHAHSLSPVFHRTQQNQLLMTQNQLYQQQTQQILGLKNEHIQDLKFKNSQLQVEKSVQFKQLLKKETQVQRLQGQNKQLHKQLQKKQKSLAEMHQRVQQMLKSSTERNNVLQSKNKQIQNLRDQLNDTRLQSAEHKALLKDYQRRLSQLHQKTLSTIQQRTLKQDEMKRKNQQLYDQNYRLQREKQQMKQRLRELTELLRQWQFKYESKVNEIEAGHAMERQRLMKQAEDKVENTVQNYQHELQRVDDEMRNRVQQIQTAYKSSLEEAYQRQKKLKIAYDQKTKSQQQMKGLLKSALDKNQEQDSLIHEFQEIVIKLKGQLSNIYDEKAQLARENGQLKYKAAQEISSIEQKLSKAIYDKSRIEKELMDLKQTHNALVHQNQSQIKYQKLYEQMEAKVEDIQTSLDVKTQLLEDKNDTIESLKQQIQALQRQGAEKIERKQFQSTRKKYEKSKKQIQQLSEEATALYQQNEDLKKEIQDLKKKNEDCEEIVIEFEKMKQTLTIYEGQILQKNTQLQQLMKYAEESKKVNEACRLEIEQQRRRCDRIEVEARNRERELKDEIRNIQIKNRKQIQLMKLQNEKYRKNALQQLQSVFLKLQK